MFESECLDAFSYSAKLKKLMITFVDGSVYEFQDVPREIVAALVISASVGRYFNNEIRDQYAYTKIS